MAGACRTRRSRTDISRIEDAMIAALEKDRPIDADGRPTNKDEAVNFLGFDGFFVTPTGEALAIYGAHDNDPFS